MKKPLSFLLVLALCCALTSCGGNKDTDDAVPQAPAASQPSGSAQPQAAPDASSADVSNTSGPEEHDTEENKILVAYFTYGENAPLANGVDASTSASIQYRGDALTGNTGLVADMIAGAAGGDLFSILTAEQYPDNYDDTLDTAQAEKGSRPELASRIDSLDSYNTVFLGFPNWWGDMPMAVYSFLDEYDFSGKTIVPFVTSGGSGFSNTIRAIESAESNATVLDGLSINGSHAPQAEDDVADWLARLGLAG